MEKFLFLLIFTGAVHSFSASDLLIGVEKLVSAISVPANFASILRFGNDGCSQTLNLNSSLQSGEILHLVGEFNKDEPETHTLRLIFEGNETFAPLSITSRMHKFDYDIEGLATIFDVKFLNGTVMNDTTPSPLKDSKQFDVRIRFLEEQIQIFINQSEIGTYLKPNTFGMIKRIKLCSGELKAIKLYRFEGGKYTNPFYKDMEFRVGQRLDISGLPVPNVFDETKMQKLFADNEKSEDMSVKRKNKGPDAKIDLEALLAAMKKSDGGGRVKRRSSSSSSRGGSSSRGSSSSGRSSSSGSRSSGSGVSRSYSSSTSHRSHTYSSSSGSSGSSGGWAVGSGAVSTSSLGSSSYSLDSGSDLSWRDVFRKPTKWYGHPEGKREFDSILGDTMGNWNFRDWIPFDNHSFSRMDSAGFLLKGMLPLNSYRYNGQTKAFSSCYECRWYCEGCCESCDFFHQQSRGQTKPLLIMDRNANYPLSERFDVTFLSKGNQTIFQLSVRFDDKVIIRKSYNNGTIEREEKDGEMPIKRWKIFDLTILNSEEKLWILFGQKLFNSFKHGASTKDEIAKIRIDGDLEIHQILLDNKMLTN